MAFIRRAVKQIVHSAQQATTRIAELPFAWHAQQDVTVPARVMRNPAFHCNVRQDSILKQEQACASPAQLGLIRDPTQALAALARNVISVDPGSVRCHLLPEHFA